MRSSNPTTGILVRGGEDTQTQSRVKTEAESGDRQLGPGTPGAAGDQGELKEAGRSPAPAPPARAGPRHLVSHVQALRL